MKTKEAIMAKLKEYLGVAKKLIVENSEIVLGAIIIVLLLALIL
tara:strand:- start:2393 stop:2524 length:132 start_codon:yes stop_codon:yes gene_type:complete